MLVGLQQNQLDVFEHQLFAAGGHNQRHRFGEQRKQLGRQVQGPFGAVLGIQELFFDPLHL